MTMTLDVLPEWIARQVRWRWPCKNFLKSRMAQAAHAARIVNRQQIENALAAASFESHQILLVHANTNNVTVEKGGSLLTRPVSVADVILGWIREAAGPDATIVMPTYPYYREVSEYDQDVSGMVLTYDSFATPSKTGLISEIFRRTKGCVRSNIPLQSMAALGPRAEEIIQPRRVPMDIPPHGEGSPHHLLCLENALVIGVGLELHRYLTLMHVAEDLRFEENRRANFYRPRDFLVKLDGFIPVRVWERRPEFARVFCREKFHRDALREGILHESADANHVDWIRAGSLLDFMTTHPSGPSYPYYLPRLAGPLRG